MVAGGRAYDAERGSWLSRDPLAISDPNAVVGDVRLGAMYGFNNGDPYRFRDPTGRQGMDPAGRGEATPEDKATWARPGSAADPIGTALSNFVKEAAHLTQCALVGCGIANAPGPNSPTYSSPSDGWYFKNTISYFALGGLAKYVGRRLGGSLVSQTSSVTAQAENMALARAEATAAGEMLAKNKGSVSAAAKGSELFYGGSKRSGVSLPTDPAVQSVLDSIPEVLRSGCHGKCGEVSLISQMLGQGVNPSGFSIATYSMKYKSIIGACESCSYVTHYFGMFTH
jgi:hypothetical protein